MTASLAKYVFRYTVISRDLQVNLPRGECRLLGRGLFDQNSHVALLLHYFNPDCSGVAIEKEVGLCAVNSQILNPQLRNAFGQVWTIEDETFFVAVHR